ALRVRARLREDGAGASLTVHDPSGRPVITVDSLVTRPVAEDRLSGPADALFRVGWRPLKPTGTGRSAGLAHLETDVLGLGGPVHGGLAALPDPVPDTVVLPCVSGSGDAPLP
ncbi:hypothetical protein G3I55_20515, partial [Streptomyces sp. SID6648]|nr:hypothetical protein [Streptomyces sp. SID6648]